MSYSPESELNDALAMTGSFTVEFWVKPAAIGTILEKAGRFSMPEYRVEIDAASKLIFRVGGDFVRSAEVLDLTGTVWVHVAASYDAPASTLTLRLACPWTAALPAEKQVAKAGRCPRRSAPARTWCWATASPVN